MTERAKPRIGGVPPGGFQQDYEVRILICYLLDRITQEMTREQLYEVIGAHDLANYFTFSAAVAGLIEQKQLSVQERDGEEYLAIQPLGRETAHVMQQGLPPAVRDRVVASARSLLEG